MAKTVSEILDEMGPEFRAKYESEVKRAFLLGAWQMALLLTVLENQINKR